LAVYSTALLCDAAFRATDCLPRLCVAVIRLARLGVPIRGWLSRGRQTPYCPGPRSCGSVVRCPEPLPGASGGPEMELNSARRPESRRLLDPWLHHYRPDLPISR